MYASILLFLFILQPSPDSGKPIIRADGQSHIQVPTGPRPIIRNDCCGG